MARLVVLLIGDVRLKFYQEFLSNTPKNDNLNCIDEPG